MHLYVEQDFEIPQHDFSHKILNMNQYGQTRGIHHNRCFCRPWNLEWSKELWLVQTLWVWLIRKLKLPSLPARTGEEKSSSCGVCFILGVSDLLCLSEHLYWSSQPPLWTLLLQPVYCRSAAFTAAVSTVWNGCYIRSSKSASKPHFEKPLKRNSPWQQLSVTLRLGAKGEKGARRIELRMQEKQRVWRQQGLRDGSETEIFDFSKMSED